MSATYIGSFTRSDGARHEFRLQARDHDHAESLLRDLIVGSATVDGELIDETETLTITSQERPQ